MNLPSGFGFFGSPALSPIDTIEYCNRPGIQAFRLLPSKLVAPTRLSQSQKAQAKKLTP
jgi:hypothetical protein